eukprot:s399_g58.t1
MLHSCDGPLRKNLLAACNDFDRLLKSFAENEPALGAGTGRQAVQQALKLQEGVGLFKLLLEEESRSEAVVPIPAVPAERDGLVPGIFPNTLEVQQLLQELDTVNGTIRALDEMMAAENIPLADCLGTSFVPTSAEAPLASNTLPGLQIPSSATLPGLPEPAAPQGLSNAMLTRDAPPSRRLADAEDTAHVASLLCSPDSPQPLQDFWEPGPSSKVSPKAPDSQQLFQVVPVEVGEAPEAPVEPPVASEAAIGSSKKLLAEIPWTQNLMDAPKVQHRNGEQSEEGHLGRLASAPLAPVEDAIESFSEDLVLQSQDPQDPQDAIQATWEPEMQQLVPEVKSDHRNASDQVGLPNSKNLHMQTAMVAESTRKNLDPAVYRNVIDVTDDHLSQTGVTGGFVPAQAMAIVPHSQKAQAKPRAARRVPLTDAVGRPLKRRRPALLSQHLRSHGLTQQLTASQRLCVSLARRRQSRQGRAWILSQAAAPSTQKSSRKMPSVDHTEPQTAKVAVSQGKSPPERPNVLFTGFSRSDLHQLKQSVNCLGGSAVRDLPTGRSAAETRVVVRCTVSEGRQIAGARTIKYLDAVLAGAWVLSPDWVHESMKAGHWLAEGKFELQGDTAKMGGPSRGRQHGPELFAGFRFHFVAQVRKPKKDCSEEAEGPAPHELVRFARRAGAEVVDTLRKLPDAKEDPPHLADELLASKRKRKRSSNSTGKETSGLPNLWWRKPIMVTVPSKATKGRGSERTTRLADELGWVILPSSWMLDCISCGLLAQGEGLAPGCFVGVRKAIFQRRGECSQR